MWMRWRLIGCDEGRAMNKALIVTDRVIIFRPSKEEQDEFLKRVKASAHLHDSWVNPPSTEEGYTTYLECAALLDTESFFIKLRDSKQLVGVINLNNIIRGALQSAYLGLYCFSGFEQQGLMREALLAIINFAFYRLDLHRIEANIQPENTRSIRMVEHCGFIKEGFSKHYLKICGTWRDHSRFAITKEQLQTFYLNMANQKKNPWEPDFVLSDAEIQTNIQALVHGHVTSIKLYSEGWDNWVYIVNEKLIFRLPRRYIAIPLIERENKILALLAEQLELAIPNPMYQGFGHASYPYPIQGYQKLPGIPAEQLQLSKENRIKNIDVMAKFLKQLHSISVKTLEQHDIEEQVFNRCNAVIITKQCLDKVKKINQFGKHIIDEEKVSVLINSAFSMDFSSDQSCLVHGDLYSRHLLFEGNDLTGIIDWGDAGINHPVVDLAVIYSFFPEEAHEKFYQYYGNINKKTKRYAAFLGAYSAIACLDYAMEQKDKLLEKEACYSLSFQSLISTGKHE